MKILWTVLPLAIAIFFVVLILGILLLYGLWLSRRSRMLIRKARESREACRRQGIELGCRVYTYDAKTDSYVRKETP